jgi:hypothetical protein
MKNIKIDLNEPFEKTLEAVLSLHDGEACSTEDELVAQALRCLYRAAHGPTLQTFIGPITIAPAVDPSLKEALLRFRTRSELLAFAEEKTSFRRTAKENGASHLAAGSALFEFLPGRLRSAESWPPPEHSASRTAHPDSMSRNTTRNGSS